MLKHKRLEIYTLKEWFVNAKKIVDMWPADGMDPFVPGEGYKTFIHTDTNDHVVKTPFKKCLNAWSKAMNAGEGVIIEADNMSLLYGTDAES